MEQSGTERADSGIARGQICLSYTSHWSHINISLCIISLPVAPNLYKICTRHLKTTTRIISAQQNASCHPCTYHYKGMDGMKATITIIQFLLQMMQPIPLQYRPTWNARCLRAFCTKPELNDENRTRSALECDFRNVTVHARDRACTVTSIPVIHILKTGCNIFCQSRHQPSSKS